ncbi:MAG: VOC family protein, partial [Terriglobia bacterium]
MRLAQPDGKIGHAEIKIGDSVIMLSDEFPDYGSLSPESVGGTPAAIHLYVEDVDALVSQAVAAGARLLRPVQDQFYGDRSGKLADPFGHVWFIATHKEDVSPEEMGRRLQAFMAQLGASSAGAGAGIRPGFTAVTPYITVQRAGELIEFVKRAFGATETYRGTGSQGGLHAEVRVGNSMLMIGGSPGMPLEEKPVSLHFYVENTDAVYQRALQAGATSIQEPADHEYGERGASVRDPFGNHWYFGARFAGPVIPEGYRSLTPYFHPRSAAPFIDFLKQAFEAEEVARYASPEGAIPHASVKIGGSMIEMGEARGPYQPMPTFIYLYVADADAAYERALRAGAASLQPPADQPYG